MPDRTAPPPSALAHGPTKSSDIERVRRDVERAKVKVAQERPPRPAEPMRGTPRGAGTKRG
jgi:hypothetical protein